MRLFNTILFALLITSTSAMADKFEDRVANLDVQGCATVTAFFSRWVHITYYKTGNNEALKMVALRRISRKRVEDGLLKAPAKFSADKIKIKKKLDDIGFTGVTKGDRLIVEKAGGQTILAYDYRGNQGELGGLNKGIFDATYDGLTKRLRFTKNCP